MQFYYLASPRELPPIKKGKAVCKVLQRLIYELVEEGRISIPTGCPAGVEGTSFPGENLNLDAFFRVLGHFQDASCLSFWSVLRHLKPEASLRSDWTPTCITCIDIIIAKLLSWCSLSGEYHTAAGAGWGQAAGRLLGQARTGWEGPGTGSVAEGIGGSTKQLKEQLWKQRTHKYLDAIATGSCIRRQGWPTENREREGSDIHWLATKCLSIRSFFSWALVLLRRGGGGQRYRRIRWCDRRAWLGLNELSGHASFCSRPTNTSTCDYRATLGLRDDPMLEVGSTGTRLIMFGL